MADKKEERLILRRDFIVAYLSIRYARAVLRRFAIHQSLQAALLYFYFADLELLDLTGHRHRELVHKPDMLGNLEVRNLVFTEPANLDFCRALAGF